MEAMIGFVDAYRDKHGVEPICRVVEIAPSTYHAHVARRSKPETAPPRVKRDVMLSVEIVAPCSMRTLSSIATGISDNLLIRAADVHLKERRPLILVSRESPLHLGHLRAMVAVTEFGAIVAPPMPAFYLRPEQVSEVVDQIALRTIEFLRLRNAPRAGSWSPYEN